MGSWFLASSIRSYVSGLLSSFVKIPNGQIAVSISAQAYFGLFYRCCIGMAIVICVFIIFLPVIKRLTGERRSKDMAY